MNNWKFVTNNNVGLGMNRWDLRKFDIKQTNITLASGPNFKGGNYRVDDNAGRTSVYKDNELITDNRIKDLIYRQYKRLQNKNKEVKLSGNRTYYTDGKGGLMDVNGRVIGGLNLADRQELYKLGFNYGANGRFIGYVNKSSAVSQTGKDEVKAASDAVRKTGDMVDLMNYKGKKSGVVNAPTASNNTPTNYTWQGPGNISDFLQWVVNKYGNILGNYGANGNGVDGKNGKLTNQAWLDHKEDYLKELYNNMQNQQALALNDFDNQYKDVLQFLNANLKTNNNYRIAGGSYNNFGKSYDESRQALRNNRKINHWDKDTAYNDAMLQMINENGTNLIGTNGEWDETKARALAGRYGFNEKRFNKYWANNALARQDFLNNNYTNNNGVYTRNLEVTDAWNDYQTKRNNMITLYNLADLLFDSQYGTNLSAPLTPDLVKPQQNNFNISNSNNSMASTLFNDVDNKMNNIELDINNLGNKYSFLKPKTSFSARNGGQIAFRLNGGKMIPRYKNGRLAAWEGIFKGLKYFFTPGSVSKTEKAVEAANKSLKATKAAAKTLKTNALTTRKTAQETADNARNAASAKAKLTLDRSTSNISKQEEALKRLLNQNKITLAEYLKKLKALHDKKSLAGTKYHQETSSANLAQKQARKAANDAYEQEMGRIGTDYKNKLKLNIKARKAAEADAKLAKNARTARKWGYGALGAGILGSYFFRGSDKAKAQTQEQTTPIEPSLDELLAYLDMLALQLAEAQQMYELWAAQLEAATTPTTTAATPAATPAQPALPVTPQPAVNVPVADLTPVVYQPVQLTPLPTVFDYTHFYDGGRQGMLNRKRAAESMNPIYFKDPLTNLVVKFDPNLHTKDYFKHIKHLMDSGYGYLPTMQQQVMLQVALAVANPSLVLQALELAAQQLAANGYTPIIVKKNGGKFFKLNNNKILTR